MNSRAKKVVQLSSAPWALASALGACQGERQLKLKHFAWFPRLPDWSRWRRWWYGETPLWKPRRMVGWWVSHRFFSGHIGFALLGIEENPFHRSFLEEYTINHTSWPLIANWNPDHFPKAKIAHRSYRKSRNSKTKFERQVILVPQRCCFCSTCSSCSICSRGTKVASGSF